MSTTQRVGRNEPCPCGSGRKFKNCCQGKTALTQSSKRSLAPYVALAIVGVGLAVMVGNIFFASSPSTQANSTSKTAASPAATPIPSLPVRTAQPPGPAPEGKVWSPEHGHWHDIVANGDQSLTTSSTLATTGGGTGGFTPQPPGPVPEGKVWSPEHGHWHDIPVQSVVTSASTAPEGATPPPSTPPAPDSTSATPPSPATTPAPK